MVAGSGEEVVDGRLRRYYDLTDAGASALEEDAARQLANATQAVERLRKRSAAARTAPVIRTASVVATA